MTATAVEPTLRITDEQIAFFHENGYLAIERITTDEEVEKMRKAYDEIFSSRAGRDEGNQFDLGGTDEKGKAASLPQILNPKKYHEDLRNTLYEANARAISKQLLGDECDGGGGHAIFKPAGYGAATPWHQDEAYWNPGLVYHSLSVWMPLQEATVENGCLYFIPGSHTLEVAPHHHINNDPRIHGLEIDEGHADESKAVACPLAAGGATFHLNRTLHYAGPNTSGTPRRAFILGFGLPAIERDAPRDFHWQRVTRTARAKRAKAYRDKDPA